MSDTNLYKQLVLNADSLGNALDYAVQSDPSFGLLYGKRPEFDPWRAYKIIKNDPVVKGAIISIIDKFMLSGWRLEGKDSKSSEKEAQDKLKELIKSLVRKKLLTVFKTMSNKSEV